MKHLYDTNYFKPTNSLRPPDDETLRKAEINRKNIVYGRIPEELDERDVYRYDKDDKIVASYTIQVIRIFKEGIIGYCDRNIIIADNNKRVLDSINIGVQIDKIRGNIKHLL